MCKPVLKFTTKNPLIGRGYVATRPTCVPLLKLFPALRRWGPSKRQGSCSHQTHLWATSDFVTPPLKRWGPPKWQGLCGHQAHLWAPPHFVPCSKSIGDPPDGTGYVATRPTCRPLLILSPTLQRWGPPKWRGLCSHRAPLWALFDVSPALKRHLPTKLSHLRRHLVGTIYGMGELTVTCSDRRERIPSPVFGHLLPIPTIGKEGDQAWGFVSHLWVLVHGKFIVLVGHNCLCPVALLGKGGRPCKAGISLITL